MIEEMLGFSGRDGELDDQVDAMSGLGIMLEDLYLGGHLNSFDRHRHMRQAGTKVEKAPDVLMWDRIEALREHGTPLANSVEELNQIRAEVERWVAKLLRDRDFGRHALVLGEIERLEKGVKDGISD